MRLELRLLALLLSSCALVETRETHEVCVTECGMRADLSRAACESLQAAETEALKQFQKYVQSYKSAEKMCAALDGYVVHVHTRSKSDEASGCGRNGSGAWLLHNPLPACVVGATYKDKQLIEVTDLRFGTNSLTHELAHAIDHGVGISPGRCNPHVRWTERGIKKAILKATGLPDTEDERDCKVLKP